MKRKPVKGELRRNKLHIPHPARRLRRTGVVRSVVPPFPTRIASLDSRGSPVPFANPLKTTKKGAAAPLPWISPGVRFVLKLFQICKTRYRCGFGKPARLSKYSAAVPDVSCTAELVALRLFDFHTSNIQRTQKSDLHGLSCAWETRFYGRPKGVLTAETKRQNARQNDKLFRRVSAISRPASLFCILFSDKPEKSMSAKRYRTNWVQKGGCNAIPASIS